jgi:hypothetical protein
LLLRVGAGAVVLYLVFTADLSRGKNPVCANALTIRGGPRLSSRPLWDAAHCLCVLLPSRNTHSCRARCALYFQVSHALPASLRTPTPAIKKTKRRFTLCKNYHLETPVHREKDASQEIFYHGGNIQRAAIKSHVQSL